MSLNHPAIVTGLLTAEELAAHNASKRCPPCHGDCWQGRMCPADTAMTAGMGMACVGDEPAEPLTPRNARIALALILLPWAVAVFLALA